MLYKVIGSVIYNFIYKYFCLDYLSLLQDKLPKHNNTFKKNKFKNLSELGIPHIFMNIITCHAFVKY